MLFAPLLLTLAQQAPPQPTFKSTVNLVEVDVVVIDKSGRPVRGLAKEDFEIREDGKPVEVATFTAVDIPAATSDSRIPPSDASATAIASNGQADDGRVILIVLDDYHVSVDAGRMATVKSTARRLVERLGPSDQAAIIGTSGRTALQVEFTSNKARLAEAIDNFFAQSEVGANSPRSPTVSGPSLGSGFGFIQEIKARWAMDALSNAAKALATIPHRRKAVLLVSQGLPASFEEIVSNRNASAASQAMRDFILTAQRSNTAIYPVDPCGLELDSGCSSHSRNNLLSIADGTGGFAVINTNAPEKGVDRMVEENGTYYLIGYQSPAPANDGKWHRIKVRTPLLGHEVRAREGYVAPRKPAASVQTPPLDALIGSAIQTRGLTMRMAAVPAPLPDRPGSALAVAIELRASDVAGGSVEFSVVAIDGDGKVRAQNRFRSTFGALPAASTEWTRVTSRLELPDGRYQVRAAAIVPGGIRGSVFTEAVVPKFTGDLALGGLSLGVEAAQTAGAAAAIADLLPFIPVATRELTAGTRWVAQVPIRASAKAAGVVTITATLVPSSGAPVQLDTSANPAAYYGAGSGGVYHVPLPAGLAPGTYRLSIEAGLGRAHAVRETSFTILRQDPTSAYSPSVDSCRIVRATPTNASTTAGSKCVPLPSMTSATAWSWDTGSR
jgi:VWFA-related protein